MAIILESRDGIATITLNRPEVLNAMDSTTYEEITEAFAQIEKDPGVPSG